MDWKAFNDKHMIDLKGKDYLPVAARVLRMRAEHPEWSVQTSPVLIGEAMHMRATVSNEGALLAVGHKRVREGQRGPAGDCPVETAETGAIGRALALCGYGTMSGDLDEGEELSDAPIEREVPARATPTEKLMLATLDGARSAEELKTIGERIKPYITPENREEIANRFKECAEVLKS